MKRSVHRESESTVRFDYFQISEVFLNKQTSSIC